MAELQAYQPNIQDLVSEIYQLLAGFMASRQIASIDRSSMYGEHDPIHQFTTIERDLITKRLMYVAITVRVLDDRESRIFNTFTDYCGTLTKDIKTPAETGGLELREACNKIIHAQRVEFDSASSETQADYLLPYVYLHGEDKGRSWAANLDIVKFCRESSAAVLKWL